MSKRKNCLVFGLFLVFCFVFTGCDGLTNDNGSKSGTSGSGSSGSTGTLIIENPGGVGSVIVCDSSGSPSTYEEFNQAVGKTIAMSFGSVDGFTYQLMWTSKTFYGTGNYLVIFVLYGDSYFKGNVSFSNGSATVNFNSMTLAKSLLSGAGLIVPEATIGGDGVSSPTQPTASVDPHRPAYVTPDLAFYEATIPTVYKYMYVNKLHGFHNFNPNAIWDSRYTGVWATFDEGWFDGGYGYDGSQTYSPQYTFKDIPKITIDMGQDATLDANDTDLFDKMNNGYYSEFVSAQFDEAEFPDGPVTIKFTKTSMPTPIQGLNKACAIVNKIVTGLSPDTYGIMDKAVKWTATYVLINIGPNR